MQCCATVRSLRRIRKFQNKLCLLTATKTLTSVGSMEAAHEVPIDETDSLFQELLRNVRAYDKAAPEHRLFRMVSILRPLAVTDDPPKTIAERRREIETLFPFFLWASFELGVNRDFRVGVPNAQPGNRLLEQAAQIQNCVP